MHWILKDEQNLSIGRQGRGIHWSVFSFGDSCSVPIHHSPPLFLLGHLWNRILWFFFPKREHLGRQRSSSLESLSLLIAPHMEAALL